MNGSLLQPQPCARRDQSRSCSPRRPTNNTRGNSAPGDRKLGGRGGTNADDWLSHRSGTVVYRRNKAGGRDPKHDLHLRAAEDTCGLFDMQVVDEPLDLRDADHLISNFITLYEDIQKLVTLAEGTCANCRRMNAGPHIVYKWADEERPKPMKLPALAYMTMLQRYSFMVITGDPPLSSRKDARTLVQMLLKRFFRVYAHLYLEHYDTLQERQRVHFVNQCFQRYLRFVRSSDLVSMSDMSPLAELIQLFEERQEDACDAGGRGSSISISGGGAPDVGSQAPIVARKSSSAVRGHIVE